MFFGIIATLRLCRSGWVQTLTVVAVCILEAAVGTTAVTAIPVAAAHIVAVVAETVALPTVLEASGRARCIWIQALAVFAIGVLHIRAIGTTAITAIPVAATKIVAIVTETVALPGVLLARTSALGSAIEARALLAERNTATAAIAAIPVTSSNIVLIVTEPITLPSSLEAGTRNGVAAFVNISFIRAVQALAFSAVGQHGVHTTAVATVPTTTTIVVSIVAETISLPTFFLAQLGESLNTLVTSFKVAIQARAVVAEGELLGLVGVSAAVTTIPITPGVVV